MTTKYAISFKGYDIVHLSKHIAMNFLKNLGERIGLFIAGVVITAFGGVLLYVLFTSDKDYDSSVSYIPIVVIGIGIGCIVLAFNKKPPFDSKKNEKTPPEYKGEIPPELKKEENPPHQ